jgi:predicted component of type VI protein secretion system
MKRILLILLSLVLAVSFAACAAKEPITLTITNSTANESSFGRIDLEVPLAGSDKSNTYELLTEDDEALAPGETRSFTVEISGKSSFIGGMISLYRDITRYDFSIEGLTITEYEITHTDDRGFELEWQE